MVCPPVKPAQRQKQARLRHDSRRVKGQERLCFLEQDFLKAIQFTAAQIPHLRSHAPGRYADVCPTPQKDADTDAFEAGWTTGAGKIPARSGSPAVRAVRIPTALRYLTA